LIPSPMMREIHLIKKKAAKGRGGQLPVAL
jgi:hypothetical protein